jgi:hypothetical protein
MKFRWVSALFILSTTAPAFAQEKAPAAPVEAGSGMPAPSDGFAVPNGQLGAGLSISRVTGARAFAELGFYTTGDSFGPIDIHITNFSLVIGGGYKIAPDLEIDAALPLSMVMLSVSSDDPDVTIDPDDDSENAYAVGNLHLGVSYVQNREPVRFKIGGAVEWGPWTIDPDDHLAAAMMYSAPAYAAPPDFGLWNYETLTLATPGHVEFGDKFVGTGDGQLAVAIPTDGRDVEFMVEVDPGFGVYVTPTVLVGARLPFTWVPTDSGSGATYLAVEPYGRFDLGQGFVNARVTLNIDEPYGFAFDDGKVWALHVGGGGVF